MSGVTKSLYANVVENAQYHVGFLCAYLDEAAVGRNSASYHERLSAGMSAVSALSGWPLKHGMSAVGGL